VVPDDTHLERDAGCFGKSECSGYAGIRHRHDDIRIGRCLGGQLVSHAAAYFIDGAALNDAVRTGEIDIFEHARAGRALRRETVGFNALVADDDDFAIVDFADEFRADNIQRTGL